MNQIEKFFYIDSPFENQTKKNQHEPTNH